MSRFSTLRAPVEARQDIKKSRFLANAGPVNDEAEARAFIASHSDSSAGHNCWAWKVGQSYRFSDDGEPSGTAGKPIFQAIEGQGLDRVAVIVSRWFGGILLGSGGLVRAYGGTAALCLRDAPTIPLIETKAARLFCAFGDLGLLQARLGAIPAIEIGKPGFADAGAELVLAIPREAIEHVARLITDLTSGRARLELED